jgi:hypothetical protein
MDNFTENGNLNYADLNDIIALDELNYIEGLKGVITPLDEPGYIEESEEIIPSDEFNYMGGSKGMVIPLDDNDVFNNSCVITDNCIININDISNIDDDIKQLFIDDLIKLEEERSKYLNNVNNYRVRQFIDYNLYRIDEESVQQIIDENI